MKAIVMIGYRSYVVDADVAVKIANVMANGERYEEMWRSKDEGGSTYHVFPASDENTDGAVQIKFISDDLYRVAKLAGAPEKK